jgi:hypothetical protein
MIYEDMDQLKPRVVCECPVFWLAGETWRCLECVPLLIENPIIFEVRTRLVRSEEQDSGDRAA